ncbi:hypothetical protein [Castellaniella sp.]|uniref:hypothetical protein n=1 Tax=Castellaniella sp. TaxID=1955812 RepID=UPI003C759D68
MNTPFIGVQTFSSPEEIWELSAFVEENPINRANYKRLIGDYNFGEEVRCCYEERPGKLCREPHKRGWVAELSDGSVTIIGNHCAEAKFGADSSLIAHRSLYNNEKRRRERLSAIYLQIQGKSRRLERMAQLRAQLKTLESRVSDFADELGTATVRILQDMAQRSQPVVAVTAVRYREYVDGEGRTKRERSGFQQRLGALAGLDLVRNSLFSSLYAEINDVERAHEEADRLGEKPKASEVDALASRLDQYDHVVRAGAQLLDLEDGFFGNDPLLFCFLHNDRVTRYRCAGIAMRKSCVTGGKEKAKAWLADQETALKQKLGVDAIEMR